jgi:hypothetical protein
MRMSSHTSDPDDDAFSIDTTVLDCPLHDIRPLRIELVSGTPRGPLWDYLVRRYHYLGHKALPGAQLRYWVYAGDWMVALLGFSAAAWQCAARDRAIGWSAVARAAGLPRIANHSRFLILPWVRVPRLASHVLGELTRRVARDWRTQHGGRLELLETFVEIGRFAGTAYAAANWQPVGATTGRTRQEKHHRAQAPRKAVWIFPLHPRFRQRLAAAGAPGGAA